MSLSVTCFNVPPTLHLLQCGGMNEFQRNVLIAATSQAIRVPAHHIVASSVLNCCSAGGGSAGGGKHGTPRPSRSSSLLSALQRASWRGGGVPTGRGDDAPSAPPASTSMAAPVFCLSFDETQGTAPLGRLASTARLPPPPLVSPCGVCGPAATRMTYY